MEFHPDLQNDTYDGRAQQLVPDLLDTLAADDHEFGTAPDVLEDWDYRMGPGLTRRVRRTRFGEFLARYRHRSRFRRIRHRALRDHSRGRDPTGPRDGTDRLPHRRGGGRVARARFAGQRTDLDTTSGIETGDETIFAGISRRSLRRN